MKNILAILAIIILTACSKEQKDYVILKGTLINPTTGDIVIQGRNFNKTIKVDATGNFEDTLSVSDGMHNFIYNQQRVSLFLKNGYDLTMTFKSANFMDGIGFSGLGQETNRYIEQKKSFLKSDESNPKNYFKLNEEDFKKAIAATESQLETWSNNAPKVDSVILKSDIKNNKLFIRYINKRYTMEHAKMLRLAKGTVSPVFIDYENNAGGTSSLSDFKGRFVYIDLWATWCGPCKKEIPAMKALETKFHGENIVFLSISLDKKSAYKTWKNMIEEKNMGGVQLIADKDFSSDFTIAYDVSSIPRFVLLDTEGNIIDADAPRPSDPALTLLLKEVLR
ncbi:MAG: thioredoxin [Flavobacteriaceae bacterium]|nr:MAG: thioredoxin [Flavobacteriaceae bacterium]